MSPAWTGCPVLARRSPSSSQRRIVPAIAARDAPLRLVAGPWRVGQRPRLVAALSARPGPPAATARPAPAGWRARSCGAGRSPGSTTPALRLGQREHGVDQPPAPPAPSGTSGRAAPPGSAAAPPAARARQLVPDAAEIGEVGTLEAVDRLLLVADHEQGARAARARPARRTAPRSACATMPHCRGLVSWASSTRTWSIRASSLNSTHSVLPGRCSRRVRALDQVVVVERRRARLQRSRRRRCVANATRSSASVRRAIIRPRRLSASRTSRACSCTGARSTASDATFFVAERLQPAAGGRQEAAPILGEQSHPVVRCRSQPGGDGRPPRSASLAEPCASAPAAASRPAAS